MTTATKKITIATVKSFIRKNREKLLICSLSRFSGMSDMVEETGRTELVPISNRTYRDYETGIETEVEQDHPSTLGIHGVWFVQRGGDSCYRWESETHTGFRVWNCCGEWIVAVAK